MPTVVVTEAPTRYKTLLFHTLEAKNEHLVIDEFTVMLDRAVEEVLMEGCVVLHTTLSRETLKW
jgi:hypothetical protein